MGESQISRTSRRDLLRRAGLGAGAVLLGPSLLSACGQDAAAPVTTTSASPTQPAAGPSPSSSPTAASLTPVGFQLGWVPSVQYAGSFFAEERGYYADEGLEVELLPGGPNNPVDPTIVSGQALIGVGATDYAARANLEGAGYTIIGAKNQSHPFCICSLAENPVPDPQALTTGLRLGVATINQPVIDAIVALNDLDPDSLTIVPTQGDPAPLANGEVDAFLTLATTGPIDLELQGFDVEYWLLSEYGYKIFSGVNMVLEESLRTDRDLITRLFRAEIRGWRDFTLDLETAVDLTVDKYAADLEYDPEQQLGQARAQLELIVTEDTEANGLFWMTDDLIAENIATMSVLGVEIDDSLFDRSVLEEIYAEGII